MTIDVPERSGRPGRLPRNYQAVYDVLCDLGIGEHAAAGEIYIAARRQQPKIGYSTVYRALERLSRLGLVAEVRIPGAQSVLYERVRESHAHFVCERCRTVQDIEFEMPDQAFRGLSTRYGVTVRNSDVTFEGLCRDCAHKKNG